MDFDVKRFIEAALREDIGDGDHTSLACIDKEAKGTAKLVAKDTGVIAGIDLAGQIFQAVDPELVFESRLKDGDTTRYGDLVFIVSGRQRSILAAERLVLNFMQRMSGIATETRKMVDAVKDYDVKILDTRKTTPTLRFFEKWAVRLGGGENHRMGLYDMILIKDNHIDFAGGVENAIDRVQAYLKKKKKKLKVIIEANRMVHVKKIIAHGGVDRIMLDNLEPEYVKRAVDLINGKLETEASGGITPDNVREYAETGVNFISSGYITHSAAHLDLTLKVLGLEK